MGSRETRPAWSWPLGRCLERPVPLGCRRKLSRARTSLLSAHWFQERERPVPIMPRLLPRVAFAVSSLRLGSALTAQQKSGKNVSAEGRTRNSPLHRVLPFLIIYF